MTEEAPSLVIEDLNVYYGSVHILHDICIEVSDREIVTLIGANGAGKTTLMMAISGVVPPRSGQIQFLGERTEKLPAHEISARGIAQVAQARHLFPSLSVRENLELGAWRWPRRELAQQLDEIYTFFAVLRERRNQKAGSLSGGEQQMLALGRALMTRPRLLLLDEPSAGLAPIMVKEIARIVRKIRDERGLTTLLVEQNASLALHLADRGYVIERGRVSASGTTSELEKSEAVRKAYLAV